MHTPRSEKERAMVEKSCIRLALLAAVLAACAGPDHSTASDPSTQPCDDCALGVITAAGYVRTDLVADLEGVAPTADADLVNPWGIVAGEKGFWMADHGTGRHPTH